MQLLMKCLLEKNGLEELLEEVINSLLVNRTKTQQAEFDPCQNTLFVLLKELFLVNTGAILKINNPNDCNVDGAGQIEQDILKVLMKFQRLLFARVFIVTQKDVCWPARCKSLRIVIKSFLHLFSLELLLIT